MIDLGNDWQELLAAEFEMEYYLKLRTFLAGEYRNATVYPDMHDIFNALRYTAYRDVRVVILGQDPYHGPGQAHGLSFSVRPEVPAPPSLLNIFRELEDDLGIPAPAGGCLIPWTRQGVLLLNTVLTVRKGEAGSHRNMGWERFTDRVIWHLNQRQTPLVFILWGSQAQAKAGLITGSHHRIIRAPHPSPLSAYRGFFGSRPFSNTNEFLISRGLDPVDWRLDMPLTKSPGTQ